jgi:hypothetical protein
MAPSILSSALLKVVFLFALRRASLSVELVRADAVVPLCSALAIEALDFVY